MQLALHHCGKEWRAQRGMLVAYSLLVFASLCLGLSLVPETWWHEVGKRALSLSWFVAAGVIGVCAFVAPGLVRAEFAAKEDQFVRRLPGALGPSFAGKLLFLALASIALPLVGLLWGELFLQAIGQPWHDLFTWWRDGSVTITWPWTTWLCLAGLLLAPTVWAIGTWLPGGRMAVGGAVLFVLLLGVLVFAVLRMCPQLENDLAWPPWLSLVAPLGLAAAGFSWVAGRRGGGPLRSARFGIVAFAIGLLPPAVWFGNEAWLYHNPDPQRLGQLQVAGLTADHRWLLAYGSAQRVGHGVPLRIDLTTGHAEQLGGIYQWLQPGVNLYRQNDWGGRRYWVGRDGRSVFDLAAGVWTPVDYDESSRTTTLPPDLQEKVAEETRAATPMRGPGDRRVWLIDDQLFAEEPDGSVSQRPWLPRLKGQIIRPTRDAGHGLTVHSEVVSFFDLRGVEIEPSKNGGWLTAFCVRDRWVYVPRPKSIGCWHQLEPGGSASVCEPLRGATVLGLLDDDTLLCAVLAPKGTGARLFLYRPADQRVEELAIPKDLPFKWIGAEEPMRTWGCSILSRDPGGRIWLRLQTHKKQAFACLDTTTHEVTVCPWFEPGATWSKLLGWPDEDSVLVQQGTEILRIDLATGARSVLFPRR
jgi:hypothetical protein